ncbi:MAG: hypothetical protein DWQ05_06285 [Calditrichaeota bacterium]|nr:MAG: hypothetical protein DWQ05_06285 [Calditrichota bacterium]
MILRAGTPQYIPPKNRRDSRDANRFDFLVFHIINDPAASRWGIVESLLITRSTLRAIRPKEITVFK